MRLVRRHDQHLAFPHAMMIAGDGDLHVAFDNGYERVERRHVFAQTMTFGKGKDGDRAGSLSQHFAANDGAALVVHQIRESYCGEFSCDVRFHLFFGYVCGGGRSPLNNARAPRLRRRRFPAKTFRRDW